MKDYQKAFIRFLVDSGALLFGDFVLKSGRRAPYFINAGNFNTGESISSLGEFYAKHIIENNLSDLDTVFGPAYKGIPLAVTTAMSLSAMLDRPVGYTFDRKEVKDHGDGGNIVGHQLKHNDKLVLVDDVVSAGTTLRASIPMLRDKLHAQIAGVVVMVDRCERGVSDKSAIAEAEASFGINIYPITNIHQIVEYLSSAESGNRKLTDEQRQKINEYLSIYGAAN